MNYRIVARLPGAASAVTTAITVVAMSLSPIVARAADAPEWLRAQVNAPLPAHDDDAGAVLMYSEQILTVQGSGKLKSIYREAYRILRPDGAGRGIVNVGFDPERRVNDLRAWSIPVQGKIYEVKRKEAIERSVDVENGILVSDDKVLQLRIPAADPGNTVGYEFEQEEPAYSMGENWSFQDSVPVREAHFKLQLPAGWTWKAFWLGHAEVAPVQTSPNEWSWAVSDLPAIRVERSMPPWRGVAGHMFLAFAPPGGEASALQSWSGVGAWYDKLARERAASSPEIKQKVAELTAGQTTTLAKMQALAKFAQKDIRYVAIELGIGGHQPHASAATFTNRYGDCKDKALLLGTMLREIGVDSYSVIINTERGSINESTPPNLGFNHVILAVKLPADVDDKTFTGEITDPTLGRLLFFDPTNDKIPFGRLAGFLQSNYGLVVTSGGGKLLKLPQTPASTSVVRTGKLTLDATGQLSGSFVESWSGDAAWWQRWMNSNIDKDTDKIAPVERVVSESLAKYSLLKAGTRNSQNTDLPFQWEYQIEAPGYAKSTGDLLFVRPRVLGVESSGLLETKKPRQNAIEFDAPSLDSDVFEITLPEGFVVDELPPPVNADVGFAAYHSKTELVGRTLRYTRSFEVKELSVPVARSEQLRSLYRTINGDERAQAVLKRAGT